MSWAALVKKGADQDDSDDEEIAAHNLAVDLGNLALESEPQEVEFDEGISYTEALQKLWDLDDNRLTPGEDYELDVQGYTGFHGTDDYARRPLFKSVNAEVFEKETYKLFKALLDNYERETGSGEVTTRTEFQEIQQFINAVMKTRPMQFCHKFLVAKGLAPESEVSFKKDLLYPLWFFHYASTKSGVRDSSGFEHVFVGEESDRKNAVTGMHNWVQLHIQEEKELLDYKGYISRNRERADPENQILTMQFTWKDSEDGSEDRKPISTSFIGVSPEFELAVYTMVALASHLDEENTTEDRGKVVSKVQFNDYDNVEIHCVVWSSSGKSVVRTCYPQC